MAVVRPYADPNARGQLNKSICFRRYRNQVILQTFPNPVDPNTTDQQVQRNILVQANRAYSLLKGATLFFYRQRGIQRRKTGKSLYMWANMNNRIPSINRPILAKSIEEMIIYKPAGFQPDNLEISIFNTPFPYPDTIYNPLDNKDNSTMISNYGINGDTYGTINLVPAKFGDGVVEGTGQSGVRFMEPVIDAAEGYYSIWFITAFDVINGRAQGITTEHRLQSIGFFGVGFFTLFQTPLAASQLTVVLPWKIFDFNGNTNLNWTAGTPVHLMVAWDTNQQWGWSSAVFVNGIMLDSDIIGYVPPSWTAESFDLFGRPWISRPGFGQIIIDELLLSTSVDNVFNVLDNRDTPGSSPEKIYGLIEDNRNVYTKFQTINVPGLQVLRLSTSGGNAINIPFRYLISVEWINTDDEIVHSVIRLPELSIPALSSIDLYLSRDWSVYWDEGLARLACTNTI